MKRLACICAFSCAVVASFSGVASADTLSPEAQAHVTNGDVQGLVRSYSPLPVQGGDGATIGSWYNDLQTASARSYPTAASLQTEAVTLAQRAGAFPAFKALGVIGMATTAAQVGWAIGSGLNAKFFHFNRPTYSGGTPVSYSNVRAVWMPCSGGVCTASSSQTWGYPSEFYPAATSDGGFWQVESGPYGDKFFAQNSGGWPWPTEGVAPWENYLSQQNGSVVPAPASYSSGMCCWIGAVATQAEMQSTFGASLPVPAAGQAFDYSTAAPSDPGVTALTNSVSSELQNHPERYPTLIPWLNHEADPGDYPDPTLGTIPVPLSNDTYATYGSALNAAGFTTHHDVVLDADHADLSKPADGVVSVSPPPGQQAPADTDVAVTTNPDTLPVLVPAPQSDETYDAYIGRLQDLGLVGQAQVLDATTMDPSVRSDGVVRTDPAVGTRVAVGTTVKVYANPDTGTGSEPAGGTDTGSGGGPPSGPTLPGFRLPSIATPCNVFPFGLPCWLYAQFASLDVTARAPRVDLTDLGVNYSIDFAHPFGLDDVGAWMAIFRPVIVFASFIGFVVWLAGFALGGSTSGGGAGESEE